MSKRRSKGDGSLFWDNTRQRWIAEVTVGYKPSGRRIVRRASDRRMTRLVGHSSTTTTETIYRKQIRPVIVHGADVMDRIFPGEMNLDA